MQGEIYEVINCLCLYSNKNLHKLLTVIYKKYGWCKNSASILHILLES